MNKDLVYILISASEDDKYMNDFPKGIELQTFMEVQYSDIMNFKNYLNKIIIYFDSEYNSHNLTICDVKIIYENEKIKSLKSIFGKKYVNGLDLFKLIKDEENDE